MNSWTRSIIQNSFNRVLNTLIIFLTTVFLTRKLGSGGFGLLTLLITNASVLNLVTSFGITSGITYNIAAEKLEESKILSVNILLLVLQLLFSLLIQLIVFLFDHTLWLYEGNSFTDLFLGVLFFISLSASEKYTAFYYGHQQYLLANNIVLVGNISLLLSLLFFSLGDFVDKSIYYIIYIVFTFLQACTLIITYHIINKESFSISLLNKEEFKYLFSYSFIAFVSNFLQFLAYRADYWLVNFYKGNMDLGWYSVSVRLAQLYWIIPNLLATIIFPKVAGRLVSGNSIHFLRLIRILNTINVFSALFLYLFSSQLIVWVFGPEYEKSVMPFMILLPGVISFCITTILASYYAGINKLMVNFWGTVLCLIIIIILDFAFIPKLGIEGAAIASSIGYTLSAIYSIIIFNKMTKIGIRKLLLFNKDDVLYLKSMAYNLFK